MRDIATITDTIRQSVTAIQAAEALGLRPDRHGRCACPIHAGKDNNLKLYPDDRGFHCFVCGASGDVIKLVQYVRQCAFLDAVAWLNSAFHLDLQIDRPLDKNAQEAAEIARKRRQMERERRDAIERAEFDLYLLAWQIVNRLEADKERYRPRTAGETWDERFCAALMNTSAAKDLAEEIATEVIGNK